MAMVHNSNSRTMSICGLPKTYHILSPQACGPWALGIHTRQTTHVHGMTITCTFLPLRGGVI